MPGTNANATTPLLHQEPQAREAPLPPTPSTAGPKKSTILIAATAVFTIVLASAWIVRAHPSWTRRAPNDLAHKVSADGVLKHLSGLAEIAKFHGNRAAGYPGYNASVHFVVETLKSIPGGCEPQIMPFKAPVWKDSDRRLSIVGPSLEFAFPKDDFRAVFSQREVVVSDAAVFFIKDACDEAEWKSFPKGSIAAVQWKISSPESPDCKIFDPINYAQRAGAAAVICTIPAILKMDQKEYIMAAMSNGDRTKNFAALAEGKNTAPGLPTIALVVVKPYVFDLLAAAKGTVSLDIRGTFDLLDCWNVICDTLEGNPDNTIVLGSHLDGVPAGPGIDDNGSGSSSNLEIVTNLYKYKRNKLLKNRVRFAWWGAEELGLLGAYAYLAHLKENDPVELSKIAMNINMDMMGAPNGYPGIGLGASAPEGVITGATYLEAVIGDTFASLHPAQEFEASPMLGGSDHMPFLEYGIPANEFHTGAGNIITPAQRERFGVIANAPADPCYHQSCDGILNVNKKLLGIMVAVAASVIEKVAGLNDLRGALDFPLK